MRDLKIRVISNLSKTQPVLLYQQDIQTNVKSFLTAAWEHPNIAPKACYDMTLPMNIAAPPVMQTPYSPVGAAVGVHRTVAAKPMLYVALDCPGQNGETPQAPVGIDCGGHEYLTITLEEGTDGKTKVNTDFSKFE